MGGPTAEDIELSGELFGPRQFLKMLDHLSASELGIGFVYAALDLLAKQYRLVDAVVVVGDESLGTQAFRLGRRSVSGDSPGGRATSPGLFCDPDIVPDVVRDVVRSVCQLALSSHVARYSASHDPVSNIANRQYFDAALRTAAAQSARYGWVFTLMLADVSGFVAADGEGHATGDALLSKFGYTLRRSVRSGDTAARIKRDEFAIILWYAEGTDVLAFTERLRSLLVPGVDQVEFAISTATSPRDSTDPVELFRIANSRLAEKRGTMLR